MANWDSADLLDQFNALAGRPATDAGITDVQKYARLARAQDLIIGDIAAIAPEVLYPTADAASYPTMGTLDNQIFIFGNDSDGAPITPIGKTQIYTSLNNIPDAPWIEGVDYLNEGTQIRIPNNGTYTGTLYWRGITTAPAITAAVQPVLFPLASRELIVVRAVKQFALEGGKNPGLAALMAEQYDDGRGGGLWPKWCLAWRTAFRQGGGLLYGAATGLQLALAGQYR